MEWSQTAPVPPIDLLSDDVLDYLVDNYLDDRSLGACLLAWRRFHVLDRARLYRRKYRLAALLSLCAAGDVEGLDYALDHPDVFGPPGGDACWTRRVRAAQSAGHARMVLRLMRISKASERFSVAHWSVLALAAALRDPADAELVWLCRRENRPSDEWDDATLIYGCTRAITSGHSPDAVVAALVAIESRAGLSIVTPRDMWRRLSNQPSQTAVDPCALLGLANKAAGLLHGMRGHDLSGLIRGGHLGLARDLIGEQRLARLLRAEGQCTTADQPGHDIDAVFWLYDHVDSKGIAVHQWRGLGYLAAAVAGSDRTDFFGAVESRVAQFERKTGWSEARAWTWAYAAASMAGHIAAVEWALAHRIDVVDLRASFERHSSDDCDGLPTRYGEPRQSLSRAWSPLVMHRNRRDLFGLLLDRRPRKGIPQDEIDARVDCMIDTTVEDALSKGDLAVVRRLYLAEPVAVEAAVGRMRARDARP